MDSEISADDEKVIQKALDTLREHFDWAQIFVGRKNETGEATDNACQGSGDWFARYGAIDCWLIKRKEETRLEVHKEAT
jgi:hypothetical protein